MEFWIDTQKHQQKFLGKKGYIRGKEVTLPNEDSSLPATPQESAQKIINEYIGSTATKAEINLSHDMQESLIEESKVSEKVVDFERAQYEVKQMIGEDLFTQFIRKQMRYNISKSESTYRFVSGLVGFIFTTTFGLLLHFLVPVYQLPRVAVALLTFVPYNASFYFLVSGGFAFYLLTSKLFCSNPFFCHRNKARKRFSPILF